jgi:hypothetical protein
LKTRIDEKVIMEVALERISEREWKIVSEAVTRRK